MGIMYFDSNPIVSVQDFIKEHYQGGTIIDFGCGCGRYTEMFSPKDYLGVDGHEGNIRAARELHPDYHFELHNLEEWEPKKQYDYLFSSVVFDQVERLPKGWAKTYILVEPSKYAEEFEPIINEPLDGSEGTRLMVCQQK